MRWVKQLVFKDRLLCKYLKIKYEEKTIIHGVWIKVYYYMQQVLRIHVCNLFIITKVVVFLTDFQK